MRAKSDHQRQESLPDSPVATSEQLEPPIDPRRLWMLLGLLGVLVTAVLAFSPVFRPSDLERASAAIADGRFDEAASAFELHIEAHPGDGGARLQLAKLLRGQNPDAALQQLRQISTEAPEFLAAVREIAVICLQSKRDAEAKQALLMLENYLPDDFGVQLSLAELLFHEEEFRDAYPHAVRAAELEPSRVQTYMLLAEIQDELNHKPDMVPPLETARRLDPDNYEAHAMLAYAYSAANRLDEAQEEAQWCLQRKQTDAFPHRILASIARDKGNLAQARELLQRALELAPDDIDGRILEADLLMYDRNYQAAYDRLKPLYEEQKEYFPYLGALAQASAATGNVEEARRLHQLIAKKYDRDGD